MMKDRVYFLEVIFPSPVVSDKNKELLTLARDRILRVFHDEARKIDPDYELIMEYSVT